MIWGLGFVRMYAATSLASRSDTIGFGIVGWVECRNAKRDVLVVLGIWATSAKSGASPI